MTLLVTRPEPQASQWARDLMAVGISAQALPLLETVAPQEPTTLTALHRAWHDMRHTALLMFVSPAAVHWFLQACPPGHRWHAGTLAAAPGPGTAGALAQAGRALGLTPGAILSPGHDSEQFDSEHLWPVLEGRIWADRRVQIVSGGDPDGQARGRRWLQDRLEQAGARVEVLTAYTRRPASWLPPQADLARQAWQAPGHFVWLFSSSQALPGLIERMGPPPPGARAIATHPRVADSARLWGFADITVTKPDLASVAQARRALSLSPTQRPDTTDHDGGIDTIGTS